MLETTSDVIFDSLTAHYLHPKSAQLCVKATHEYAFSITPFPHPSTTKGLHLGWITQLDEGTSYITSKDTDDSYLPLKIRASETEFTGSIKVEDLTGNQIIQTDGNKNLISVAPGTAYNKNFGNTAGTVCEGNDPRLSSISYDQNLNTNFQSYKVNGVNVVSNRVVGWQKPIGNEKRNVFNTATVTLVDLAEHVAALINDLYGHGLIGN